jgi:hypothetical protein
MLAFSNPILFKKVKLAHFIKKEIFFSQEQYVLFGKPTSSMLMVVDCLLSWLKYRRNCSGNFPTGRRRQASLVKEAQDGMSHHNTWSSRTSCGVINLYILMG